MENARQPASDATISHQRAVAASADLTDPRDEVRARRGFLSGPLNDTITGRFDHAVWDFHAFDFETSEVAPDSVNPSLWRQARLNNIAGLFEVVDGIYQVRGFDISNITFIRGDRGWVVLDPLTSAETARAAYELVTATLGERPITAVMYSHSHVDHYGGVRGILTDEQCADPRFPIIAPSGFLHEAVSENVMAGTVMLAYYFEYTDTFSVHVQGFFCYDTTYTKPYLGPEDSSAVPPVLLYALVAGLPTLLVSAHSICKNFSRQTCRLTDEHSSHLHHFFLAMVFK